MKSKLSLLLAALILLWIPFAASAADLQVEIKGLRNSKGQIKVGLYQKDGFPDSGTEFRGVNMKPVEKKAAAVFKDVPEGTYAVGIIHDENMDGRLGKNALGIPNEGYAFSNDVRGKFGPPPFEEASFSIGAEEKRISITMKY